jgi:hypothetical protein
MKEIGWLTLDCFLLYIAFYCFGQYIINPLIGR